MNDKSAGYAFGSSSPYAGLLSLYDRGTDAVLDERRRQWNARSALRLNVTPTK